MSFQTWRRNGLIAIPPTYVRSFLAVLDGARTVRQVATATGIAETTTNGHLKRLRGLGLITWDTKRAGTITALYGMVHLDVVEYGGILACFPLDDDDDAFECPEVERPTNVMDLRKGDVLTVQDGVKDGEYMVTEVRQGKRGRDVSVRLRDDTIKRGEFWVHIATDDVIDARRPRTVGGEST